jgi:hypothetical protein
MSAATGTLVAAGELGERHRRVDVVEGGGAARPLLRQTADRDAFGHVGADDHGVGLGDRAAVRFEAGEVRVERQRQNSGSGRSRWAAYQGTSRSRNSTSWPRSAKALSSAR